jgi:hypothetical protein
MDLNPICLRPCRTLLERAAEEVEAAKRRELEALTKSPTSSERVLHIPPPTVAGWFPLIEETTRKPIDGDDAAVYLSVQIIPLMSAEIARTLSVESMRSMSMDTVRTSNGGERRGRTVSSDRTRARTTSSGTRPDTVTYKSRPSL